MSVRHLLNNARYTVLFNYKQCIVPKVNLVFWCLFANTARLEYVC